jgi:hypothetical protein
MDQGARGFAFKSMMKWLAKALRWGRILYFAAPVAHTGKTRV